jgi:hypothetical protein
MNLQPVRARRHIPGTIVMAHVPPIRMRESRRRVDGTGW